MPKDGGNAYKVLDSPAGLIERTEMEVQLTGVQVAPSGGIPLMFSVESWGVQGSTFVCHAQYEGYRYEIALSGAGGVGTIRKLGRTA